MVRISSVGGKLAKEVTSSVFEVRPSACSFGAV
jgi:hypothetical protein